MSLGAEKHEDDERYMTGSRARACDDDDECDKAVCAENVFPLIVLFTMPSAEPLIKGFQRISPEPSQVATSSSSSTFAVSSERSYRHMFHRIVSREER
jgi:hypothetical protein